MGAYKTANGTVYDSGDFAAVMDDALKHSDWTGFAARRAASERAGKLRGIGIATYLEAGGGGSAPKDQVAVEFDTAGGMTLFAVTQSSGQGHETIYPQIVAETLGIDAAQIHFYPRPPDAELMGSGTGGSRGALGTGSTHRWLPQAAQNARSAKSDDANRATGPAIVTPAASALKLRNNPPDQRWHIRQWQAAARGSCAPATVIVTAPHRQCPVSTFFIAGLPRAQSRAQPRPLATPLYHNQKSAGSRQT